MNTANSDLSHPWAMFCVFFVVDAMIWTTLTMFFVVERVTRSMA